MAFTVLTVAAEVEMLSEPLTLPVEETRMLLRQLCELLSTGVVEILLADVLASLLRLMRALAKDKQWRLLQPLRRTRWSPPISRGLLLGGGAGGQSNFSLYAGIQSIGTTLRSGSSMRYKF